MGAKSMPEDSKKKAESANFSERLVRSELKLRDKGVDAIWCTLLIFLDIIAGLWGSYQIASKLVEEMPWGAPGLLVEKHVAVFLIIGRFGGRIVTINSGIILLTGCSYLLTWLRDTRVARFLPLDNLMPHWHLCLAFLTGAAAAIHTIAITCLYASALLNWSTGLWSWSADGVRITQELVTGILLVVILASMLTIPFQRRKHFKLFWVHHLVGMLLYMATLILHGCFYGRPITWAFLALPILLYAADRCLRMLKATTVIDGAATIRALDGDIICLEIPRAFDFHSGMYARICVPELSPYEYHPFTIASSPLEDTTRFYIKALGDWTRALLALAKQAPREHVGSSPREEGKAAPAASDASTDPQAPAQAPPGDSRVAPSPPPVTVTVKVTGPFGAPAQHFSQFAKVVLVSTGIGVTPMSSIIRDLFFRRMRLYQELLRRMPAAGTTQVPVSTTPAAGMADTAATSSGSATPPEGVPASTHPMARGTLDPSAQVSGTGSPALSASAAPTAPSGEQASQAPIGNRPLPGRCDTDGLVGRMFQGDPATQEDPASHSSIGLSPLSTPAMAAQDASSQHAKGSTITATVASLGRRPTLTRLIRQVTRLSPWLSLSRLDSKEARQAEEASVVLERQQMVPEEMDSVDAISKMLGEGVMRNSSLNSTSMEGVQVEIPKSDASSSVASQQVGGGRGGGYSQISRWWVFKGGMPGQRQISARPGQGDDVEKKRKRKEGEAHTNRQHAMEYRLLNRLAELKPAVGGTRWERMQLWAAKAIILLQLSWVSLTWTYISLFASLLLAAGIIGFAFIANLWTFNARGYQIASITLVAVNAPGLLVNLVMTVTTMGEETQAASQSKARDGRGGSLLQSLLSGKTYVGRLRLLLVVISTIFLLGSITLIGAALRRAVFHTPAWPSRCPWWLPPIDRNGTAGPICGVAKADPDSISTLLWAETNTVGSRPRWDQNVKGYFGNGNWADPVYGGNQVPGNPGELGPPGGPPGGPGGERRLLQQVYGSYGNFSDFCVGTRGREVELGANDTKVWCDYGGLIETRVRRNDYHVAWIVWIVIFCTIEAISIALTVRRVFSTTTLKTDDVNLNHLHTRTLSMIWVGQDLTGFHWFFASLRDLVNECSQDGAMADFLRCKIFLTRAKKEEQAALRASVELLPFIEVHFTRPDWDQVISEELLVGRQRYKHITGIPSSSSSMRPAQPPVCAPAGWHNPTLSSNSGPLRDTPPVNAEDAVILNPEEEAAAAPEDVHANVVSQETCANSLPTVTKTQEHGEAGPAVCAPASATTLPQQSASTDAIQKLTTTSTTRSKNVADQPLVPSEAGFVTLGIFFCGSHVVAQSIADACLTTAQRQVMGTEGDLEKGGTKALERPALPDHVVFRKENF
eukprot:jgi/Mesvir1/18027/Mv09350-RA.1